MAAMDSCWLKGEGSSQEPPPLDMLEVNWRASLDLRRSKRPEHSSKEHRWLTQSGFSLAGGQIANSNSMRLCGVGGTGFTVIC